MAELPSHLPAICPMHRTTDNINQDPNDNCRYDGDPVGLNGMCLQGTPNCGSCTNCCFGNTCSFNGGDNIDSEPQCYNCRTGNMYT
jgi:hypothetical protein